MEVRPGPAQAAGPGSPQPRRVYFTRLILLFDRSPAELLSDVATMRAKYTPGCAGWPSRLLAVLSGGAVLFTVYLTYLELFVIHAVCRWCVGSAVIILAIFGLSLADLRRRSGEPA